MTQTISSSSHDDMIHDAVLDHSGRHLATCSSDKTIKIFAIDNDTHRLTETLKGHDGAIWSLSWAHPTHGTILASASYDGRILIHRQQNTPQGAGGWQRIYDFTLHTASVNLVAWSPPETGCHLAAASSDGSVSVLTFDNNTFTHVNFTAHGQLGANSVSLGSGTPPRESDKRAADRRRRDSGAKTRNRGSDNLVKIWEFDEGVGNYELVTTLRGHNDWVRDVAWSPTPLGRSYLASASQDHTVKIWTLPAGGDMADATGVEVRRRWISKWWCGG